MTLEKVSVGQMSGYDVGRRILVTSEGLAFDGILTDLSTKRSDYDLKDRDRLTVSIVVKQIEPATGVGIARDKTVAEIKLGDLPLDYLVQRDGIPEIFDAPQCGSDGPAES